MWKNTRMIILTAVCAAIYWRGPDRFQDGHPVDPGDHRSPGGQYSSRALRPAFRTGRGLGGGLRESDRRSAGQDLESGIDRGLRRQLSPGLSALFPVDPVGPFSPENPGVGPRWNRAPDGPGRGREIIPLFGLEWVNPSFFSRKVSRPGYGRRPGIRPGPKCPKWPRRVGLVLQDFEAQLFSTSVELEMVFGLENIGLPRGEMEARIQHYLKWVGLEKMRQREPAGLSGGEKQRLAIGAVLAMEPDFLVLDEPTTDLDPAGRQAVYAIMNHWRKLGKTLDSGGAGPGGDFGGRSTLGHSGRGTERRRPPRRPF